MILGQVSCVMSILLIGSCYGQGEAEVQGSATVMVAMEEDDFLREEHDWRYVMAWHASRHCKTGKDNCWGEDKQIRYHDVIITATTNKSPDVSVEFYIRDRYDHTKAGLSSQQVRSFFLKYESEIVKDFGSKDMTLVFPEDEGMEAWLIAVIVICSVVGAALIIAVIALAVKQHKYKKRDKTRDEIRSQLHDYNLTLDANLSDGKINPVYDSDSDKPTTSGSSEKVKYYNVAQSTSAHSESGHNSDKMAPVHSNDNRVSSLTLKSNDASKDELSDVATIYLTQDDNVSVHSASTVKSYRL